MWINAAFILKIFFEYEGKMNLKQIIEIIEGILNCLGANLRIKKKFKEFILKGLLGMKINEEEEIEKTFFEKKLRKEREISGFLIQTILSKAL